MDVQAATNAYIDAMGPERLARAIAYTTGNHWILLASLVVSIITAYLVARSNVLTHRWVKHDGKPNRTAATSAAAFLVLSALITLPWTLYTDWFRQHTYQRSSQPLGDFLGQWALSTAVSALIGAIMLMVIYLALRRAGARWWLWATGIVAVGMTLLMLAAPVVIEPLFNKYQPLPDGAVRDALLPMSTDAGVPSDRIFVYDGSRQSNNFTANAGGVGSTARIAISDVAFKGATLDEVRAVTGHEIGHYVLKHSQWGILLVSLLSLVSFFSAGRLYPTVARLLSVSAPMTDPAGLPALITTISLVSFVATPFLNTMSRHFESQADRYSLEHVGEADGLATALVKTADYRNPRPGLIEETIFYDHPSVERRIRNAMQWKSINTVTTAPTLSAPAPSHAESN
jgi:STE24 endopeptidase